VSEGGTYTLRLERPSATTLTVGALGSHRLPAGGYAYVGSALGTGGFARVDRHRRVAAGEHETRHWHVDYLIGAPETRLVGVVTTAGADAECAVADRVGAAADGEPVPGFGASDCDCRSHLFYGESAAALRAVVEEAHATVGRKRGE
jgi:endonuclease-3